MRLGVILAGVCACLGLAPAAYAANAAQTVAILNQERAANGIPAGLTVDPVLSQDCALHDAYMAANNSLTHIEVPGRPGYTPGGAFAGAQAVLTQGAGWDAGDPYEASPLHLDQLLAPRLLTVGSADLDGYSCTTTFPGWTRPAPAALTVYTDPGNATKVAPQETASEQPFTPGQLVGLRAGATTGPYLLVFVDAPGQSQLSNPATLTGATLTGPSGPVNVVTADGDTRLPAIAGATGSTGATGGTGTTGTTGTSGLATTLAGYIAPGGFIIPTAPLQPAATYTAHVTVGFAGVQTPYTWTFQTTARDPKSSLVATGALLRFGSASSASATVTFARANGDHAPTITIAPGRSAKLNLAPGSWTVCGAQPAQGEFAAYQQCITLTVTGVPVLAIGPGRVTGKHVTFHLRMTPVLRLRPATLTVTPVTRTCTKHACHTTTATATTRTVTLQSVLSLPLPAAHHGVNVKLTTAAFQLADAPWTAATATARYLRG